MALYKYVSGKKSPAHQAFVYFESKSLVMIYDAFPKAKVHLLCFFNFADGGFLNSIFDLQKVSI